MYDLETIVRRNREAERLGIIKAGSAVGTTGFVPHNEREGVVETKREGWNVGGQPVLGHREDQGGLRGHSIGDDYPFSVVGIGLDGWRVQNLLTGEEFETYEGPGACERAHDRAHELKVLSQTAFTRNEEY